MKVTKPDSNGEPVEDMSYQKEITGQKMQASSRVTSQQQMSYQQQQQGSRRPEEEITSRFAAGGIKMLTKTRMQSTSRRK
jgi:hypothetical protein